MVQQAPTNGVSPCPTCDSTKMAGFLVCAKCKVLWTNEASKIFIERGDIVDLSTWAVKTAEERVAKTRSAFEKVIQLQNEAVAQTINSKAAGRPIPPELKDKLVETFMSTVGQEVYKKELGPTYFREMRLAEQGLNQLRTELGKKPKCPSLQPEKI